MRPDTSFSQNQRVVGASAPNVLSLLRVAACVHEAATIAADVGAEMTFDSVNNTFALLWDEMERYWARGTTSVDESRDFIKNAKQRKKDLVGIYEPDKKGKAAAGANSYTPAAGKKQQQGPYCTFCQANGHSTYACRKKAKQAKTTQEHATKVKPKM